MKLIEFFGLKVKPRITKGKQMFNPIPTGRISNQLYAIRDKDVNCFLIKSDTGYIAIDSGYKNSKNIRLGLDKLGINPMDVVAVFLTHLDIDHAGGCDVEAGEIFPNARIYLSQLEFGYLTGKACRKKIGFIKLKMPIKLGKNIEFISENNACLVGGITIKPILSPGHSVGHVSYIVGDILFIGDALVSDGHSGWCFYDFWNMNTMLNKQSLSKLEKIALDYKINQVITSHTGIIESSLAFINKNHCPDWKKKGFKFIKDAPLDVYKDEVALDE